MEAFADCDEANCAIGTAIALGNLDEDVKELLLRVQNDLFDVGADLCTPVVENPEVEPLRVTEAEITALEVACDKYNAELKPLRSFILPGGTAGSALLHVARTVVRRAERSTWTAFEQFDDVNILAGKYLNRLSDLLFILARYANRHEGDVLWVPGKNR